MNNLEQIAKLEKDPSYRRGEQHAVNYMNQLRELVRKENVKPKHEPEFAGGLKDLVDGMDKNLAAMNAPVPNEPDMTGNVKDFLQAQGFRWMDYGPGQNLYGFRRRVTAGPNGEGALVGYILVRPVSDEEPWISACPWELSWEDAEDGWIWSLTVKDLFRVVEFKA